MSALVIYGLGWFVSTPIFANAVGKDLGEDEPELAVYGLAAVAALLWPIVWLIVASAVVHRLLWRSLRRWWIELGVED